MAKIFQTLRNNWKKSIVFSGAFVYGVNYGKDRWKENELMRKFAAEAVRFGEKSIPLANTRSYHVTVILNPAANGGKARKNYEQYCAPLLHLAGLKVSVIRTEAQSTDPTFFNLFLHHGLGLHIY
jgi:acylglycerol kinase